MISIANEKGFSKLFLGLYMSLLAIPSHTCPAAPPHEQLELLRQTAETHRLAGDRDQADAAVAEIIKACDVVTGPDAIQPDDPARIKALLYAVKLDMPLGNVPRALSTCQTIIADAKPGSIEMLDAEALKFSITMNVNAESMDDAIELIAKSCKLPENQRERRDNCQILVFDAIVMKFAASELSPPELDAALLAIEHQMIDRDVPVKIAKLSRIAQAEYGRRRGEDEWVADALSQLRNVIDDELVSHYRRAQFWNYAAGMHEKRRHFAAAFDACRRFEDHATAAGRPDLKDIATDQSALITLRMGDYAAAKRGLESTRQSHEVALPSSVGVDQRCIRLINDGTWSVNLAKAMEGANEILPARNLLDAALAALKKNAPFPPKYQSEVDGLTAMIENNLGLNHYLTGEFQKADELIQGVNATLMKIKASPERLAEGKVNAGWIAFGKKDVSTAARLFGEAASDFLKYLGEDHPRYAEAMTYQARVAAAEGQRDRARHWIERAEKLVYGRLCKDLAATASARDRIALIQEARVHPESIAWPGTIDTYLELAPKLGISAKDQLQVVLRWKGLANRFEKRSEQSDAANHREEQRINANLRAAYKRSVPIFKRRALLEEISGYETELSDLERRRSAAQLTDMADVEQPDLEQTVAALRPPDVFIDIFQIRNFRQPSMHTPIDSARSYVAFIVDHTGNVSRMALGSVYDVDASIVSWGNIIRNGGDEMNHGDRRSHRETLRAAAQEAANLVQRPILQYALQTGITLDRVLIRPDSGTHLIPWAALPGTNGKSYWIENVRVQICHELPSTPIPVENEPALLVVGGVDFGPLKSKYPPLPGSLVEREDVANAFAAKFPQKPVVKLGDQEATKSALVTAMPGKKYIHLATHGFYDRSNESDVFGVTGATAMLQTGLIVAEGGNNRYDQYLTAADIAETDLSAVSLVVLSACESGLGKPRAGQGVQGMLGSFHAAGVQYVVGTLWVVGDEPTVTFVDLFYQHLWNEGLPPVDALRSAQLDMIHQSHGTANAMLFSDPYAWAPFICSVSN